MSLALKLRAEPSSCGQPAALGTQALVIRSKTEVKHAIALTKPLLRSLLLWHASFSHTLEN
jgi:hypothetical protein